MNHDLYFDKARNEGQLFLKAASAGRGGKVTSFTASTPGPDRAEDIVLQDWRLENFKANPVIMWAHQYDIPPVGKAVVDSIGMDARGNLRLDVEWDDSEHNALGQLMKHQYANGYLSAGSVGFRPTTVTPRSSLPSSDPRSGERGLVFGGNELLEFSAAPIPMNAQALAAKAFVGLGRSLAAGRARSYGQLDEALREQDVVEPSQHLLDAMCPDYGARKLSDVLADAHTRSASRRPAQSLASWLAGQRPLSDLFPSR